MAIQNARLYQETQRNAREMAALAEIGRDVSATLDLPTVLERIAAHAKELLAADTSAVFLPEPGGRAFRAITVLGADAEAIQADTIALGEGIIGDLARRGAAEVIHDTNSDLRIRQIPGTIQQDVEQLMVAPLLAGERVSGMMVVWRTGKPAWPARPRSRSRTRGCLRRRTQPGRPLSRPTPPRAPSWPT